MQAAVPLWFSLSAFERRTQPGLGNGEVDDFGPIFQVSDGDGELGAYHGPGNVAPEVGYRKRVTVAPKRMARLPAEGRKRRLLVAAAIYVVATAVFFACAARETLTEHTPYNHFALTAQSWIHGQLDLGSRPPAYTFNNDFARYEGRWYAPFPPFPAVLLLPLVALAGGAGSVQDGQFFLWLAGLAPAVLFLALEKLRRSGRNPRSETDNWMLSLLFAFGSVYFFSAVQGTVWYAAHVVGAALAAFYLLFALDAERPLLAGLMLGLGFATRTPLVFAFPLFVLEAARKCQRAGAPCVLDAPIASLRAIDPLKLARALALFALPIAAVVALCMWHNAARFDDPFEVGYRYLDVAWAARIEKWGLFSYHYLARNLGVVLTSLPYLGDPRPGTPFQINAHGLALWFTTPLYLWLLWPKSTKPPHHALWITVACVALPTLLYQNTGWVQFGYRFSNDYAVFLFALLAVGARPFGWLFRCAAVWAVAWNCFGALSFNRREYSRYYYQDNSQRILYQED